MPEFDFSKPVVILAPMAGYSDAPMREITAQWGVDGVVSEMMACQEWRTGKEGVAKRVIRGNLPSTTRYIVQIAGREPALMVEAARFAQDQGAEQIDINMGCPAKKVISGATAGAALLLEPKLASEIIENVANAVKIPVSVKTRLGWDDHNTKNIIGDFENAGACGFTIHGRTRQQKYQGKADWEAVGEIKSRTNLPVFVNGDIATLSDAQLALSQSMADGLMIGRAAIGNPQLLSQIRMGLRGETRTEGQQAHILHHFDKILHHYGEEFGVLCARKHLKAYFAGRSPVWLKSILMERDALKLRKLIALAEAGA